MKISAKARYALASAIEIARLCDDEYVSAISLSKSLGISKIFLEQVMASLKKAEIVISAKGAGGGYRLARTPQGITAHDILVATEGGLFEKTDSTVDAPGIESAMREIVFNKLDVAVNETLKNITLQGLLDAAISSGEEQSFMINL